jgi:hypothetical protein
VLLDRYGLLLLHDAKFPSATAAIAGEVVRGSWWGHPKGKLIFETLTRVEDDVAWAKLVLGKETLIHRRLWPPLVAVAGSRQAWQWRGLPATAQALLRRVRRGPVRTDEPRGAGGRGLGGVATELERRLLARATSEHTATGHHARLLETWQAWGKRQGIARKDLPGTTEGMKALSVPVLAWTGGARPPGLLPWYKKG